MKKTTNFFLTVLFFAVSLIAGGSNGNSSAYQSGGNDHIVLSQNLPTASSLADLALDWQQNSHVTWRSGRDIFYACTDMSGNWLLKENGTPVPNRKMATLSTATFAPAIAVDSKGNAHIVAANGISAILYLKLAADGTELIRRTLTFKVNLNWVYFHGADVAIDPKTDLPVVGTMCVLETSTTVSGYPMTKHQERIYGLQLDASGEITDKIFFAASDWALGCPPYVFGHPAIDVDNNGVVHAVWKTRMLVDSAKEDSSDIGSSIGGAIGISSSNSSPDPNGSLAEKFRASNRHGVSYSVGDIMIEYARSDKVSQGVAKMLKFGGVYINTPGDIKQGTYLPLPRIVCDDEDRVHVAWNGMNGDKPAILYSRIWADTEDSSGSSIPELMQMGVIEQRSVQVNSAQAKVREDQCDLAVGDSAVHFVWIDARNSISGSQVFHGAVSLSGVVQESQEYAISSRRNNDLTLPRIAFRADRVFKEWVGYNGDNTPGADDLFVATDAETAVNLYPAQEIRITATYEPWLHGEAAASDPEIVLQGNPDGLAYERVFLAADDGRGQYTVLWQESFP
jgi:hypothetical protein